MERLEAQHSLPPLPTDLVDIFLVESRDSNKNNSALIENTRSEGEGLANYSEN